MRDANKMKLNCDEINSICSDVVRSFLNDLDDSVELTTGHTLSYDEQNREWLWFKGGCAGSAAELLHLEATKLSCSIDDAMPPDDYKRSVAAAVENLVASTTKPT